jgi:hypothetical protein
MARSEQRLSIIEEDLKEIARLQRRNEAFLESFSEEMREFKDEMRASKKEMDRKWGELANKMGTVVEDIILPGFPGILRRYFNTEADIIMPRVKRRHPRDRSRRREFDIVAVDAESLFLNETKSTPRMQYVEEFVQTYGEVREYFPEYAEKALVPIFSSLYLDEESVAALTANGCYAMTMGEDHLDIVNFEAVRAPGAREKGGR